MGSIKNFREYRAELYDGIHKAFAVGVERFQQMSNAADCSFEQEIPRFELEEPNFFLGTVHFESFAIIFKYTVHMKGDRNDLNSILECLVRLDSDEEAMAYPIQLVMNIINPEGFDCFVLPMITSGKIMTDCFVQMSSLLMKFLKKIEELSLSDEKHHINDEFLELLHVEEEKLSKKRLRRKKSLTEDEKKLIEKKYYEAVSLDHIHWGYCKYIGGNYQAAMNFFNRTKEKDQFNTRWQKQTALALEGGGKPSGVPDSLKPALEKMRLIDATVINGEGVFVAATAVLWGALIILLSFLFKPFAGEGLEALSKMFLYLSCGMAAVSTRGILYEKLLRIFKREKQRELYAISERGETFSAMSGRFVLCGLLIAIITAALSIYFSVN